MSIVVDEEEPLVVSSDGDWYYEDDPPFEPRNVTIRTDKWVTKDFKILDFLGRGKFGEVKRCREHTTGREFAAKFIVAPRPQDKKDVEHEVNVMMKLQHKRLLQLYDAFQKRDEMCLVLEIILGGELFDRVILDDFILTERACMVFMRQICEGVDYMVSKNIIHLDLKPENILCLTRTGNRIKIIDFGLAREYDPKGELRVLFGTPEFMAPEVVQFDPIDFATDMWSVGVICYVFETQWYSPEGIALRLSGLSPFMGDNDGETLANVTKGAYDFDYAEFEDISEDAKDLIRKLLVKDGKQRLTASQCLEHPWLRRKSPFERQLQLSKKRLKKFVYRRKWQKIVNAIIALKRMGVQLKSISEASKAKIHTPESLFGWETTATVGPGHDHADPPRDKLANKIITQMQNTNAHGHVTPGTSQDTSKGKAGLGVTKEKAPEIVVKETTPEVEPSPKSDICKKRSPSPKPFNKDSIKRANRWGKDKEDKTVELGTNLSKKPWEKKKGGVEIPGFLKKAEQDLPDLSKKKNKEPEELPNLSKKTKVSTEEKLPDLSKPKQNELPDLSRKKPGDKFQQNKADLPDLTRKKSPEKKSKFVNKVDDNEGLTNISLNKTSPEKRLNSPEKKPFTDTKPPLSPDKKRSKDKAGGSRTPSSSPEKKVNLDKKPPDKPPPSPEKKLKPWERKQEQPVENKVSPEKTLKPWEKRQENVADKKISPEKKLKPWEKKQEQPLDNKTSPEKTLKPWEKKQEQPVDKTVSPEKTLKPWEKKKEPPVDKKASPEKSIKPWERKQDAPQEKSPEKKVNKTSPEKILKPWERKQEQPLDKTSPEKKIKPWERKQDSPQEKSPEKKVLPWQKKNEPSEKTPEGKMKPWQRKSEAGLGQTEVKNIEKRLPQWQRKSDAGLFQSAPDKMGAKNKSQEPEKKLKPWEKPRSDADPGFILRPMQAKSSQSRSPSKSPEKQPGPLKPVPEAGAVAGGDSSASCEVLGVISNVVWQAEPVITVVNDIMPTVSCEHEVTAACVVLKPSSN